MERLPFPVPWGWFCIGYADELLPGELRPVRYFGRELVLFRTAAGSPALLDAWCPHLGAHLGHGGRVEGELLRCPFHGWGFRGDGSCADVPYAKRIPPRAQARSHPVVERSQVLWAWYHPAGAGPSFEVEEHPEVGHPDWMPLDRHSWRFRSNPQEIAENGVDPAHFRYVHKMDSVPEGRTTYDGVRRVSTVEGERSLVDPDGRERTIKTWLQTVQNGAGQKWTRFKGLAETLLLVLATPVTDQEVELRFAFTRRRAPAGSFEERAALESIRGTAAGVEDDIRIWSHKVYREKPVLCDGDGPIPEFRRYFRQFYAG